jgi:hypothetical protein
MKNAFNNKSAEIFQPLTLSDFGVFSCDISAGKCASTAGNCMGQQGFQFELICRNLYPCSCIFVEPPKPLFLEGITCFSLEYISTILSG